MSRLELLLESVAVITCESGILESGRILCGVPVLRRDRGPGPNWTSYNLPLIRPSGFVKSGRQRSSSQELLELLGDGRRYNYHRMLSRFLPIIPKRHVIPL